MQINGNDVEHYEVPRIPNFHSAEIKFELTESSKKLFEQGQPGQGYIGLVELPEPNKISNVAKIHLIPAFNKNDGLARMDKDGRTLEVKNKEFVESVIPLGGFTGDLHVNAARTLGLGEKAGQNGLLMGFGIWKSGYGVKFLNELPPREGLIPHEFLFIYNRETTTWQIYSVDEKRDVKALELEKDSEIANLIDSVKGY